ncbi:MAG: Clp protease [Acidobacteria bacterium]|nr:MAG: Clp protease [Acidobacteriota bacterium]PYY03442.1 MAG: Clp protease [Acidobacteriota bacterium]PYY23166.1 MAG: Clp protease [Acidobacteriota bacterium]
MIKAAFLDRDGVINQKAPGDQYVTRWEDMYFFPGVSEAISQLNQAGYLVVVVTNQRCVAKGLLGRAELASIHDRMTELLSAQGARIDAIYDCLHDLDDDCSCRKPKPGMLLRAAHELGVDLQRSWMIGDSEIDIQAGKNAGCKTIRLKNGGEIPRLEADFTVESLAQAVDKILEHQEAFASVARDHLGTE